MIEQVDHPNSPHVQTALAIAALTVAVVRTLQELIPDEDALPILQSKVAVEVARLRRTPDAETATAIFRFVRDTLRNSDIVEQSLD
jgi:hypothetical protein